MRWCVAASLAAALMGALGWSGCAKSTGAPPTEDGGPGRDEAVRDAGTPADAPPASPADSGVVGPSCGDVRCAPFEACVDGACRSYDRCIDEDACDTGQVCRNRYCLPEDLDVDDDGVAAAADCDESDPGRYPGAEERCDTRDQDCDDAVDEDVTRECSTACGAGVEVCTDGEFTGCDAPPVIDETCDLADEDCDGRVDEGLERGCSTACGSGSEVCEAGAWVMCSAPAPQPEACNLLDDDCNGVCDDGAPGCRNAVHRAYKASSGEHFYTLSREEPGNAGFRVEFFDYYHLYGAPQPGLVPFYRCLLRNGYHLYTQSDVCEGAPGSVNEGLMGYIANAPGVCGSVPLYRLVGGPDNNDHLYTLSAAERDNAVAGGYTSEGVAGYVWPTR